MKKLLVIVVVALFARGVNAQSEIETLNAKREALTLSIKVLNDSLKIVNNAIIGLESKEILNRFSNKGIVATCKANSVIWDGAGVIFKVVKKITVADTVLILDYKDNYYGVYYRGFSGYINETNINKNKDLTTYTDAKKVEMQKIKDAETVELNKKKAENEIIFKKEIEKNEAEYIARFGNDVYNKLKAGKFWIGMTDEMATISLGKPTDINRTVGAWGVHEQWIYGNTYLYFENGICTSYQN